MKFDQMRLATVAAVSTAVLGGCGPSGHSAANNCAPTGANRDWNDTNSGANPANCQRTGGGGPHFFFFGGAFGGARRMGAPAAVSRGGFGGTAGMVGGEGGVGE